MFKACKSLILLLSCALTVPVALAEELLRADHPDQYTVVKGDTLWDIAEFYTGNAFNYPELAKRSGIKNPDRIYPGDKVRIIIR